MTKVDMALNVEMDRYDFESSHYDIYKNFKVQHRRLLINNSQLKFI